MHHAATVAVTVSPHGPGSPVVKTNEKTPAVRPGSDSVSRELDQRRGGVVVAAGPVLMPRAAREFAGTGWA